MGLKAILAKPLAAYITSKVNKESRQALQWQEYWFKTILDKAKDTAFGKDHQLATVRTHKDYTAKVPVKDYEGLKPYFDRVVKGEENVLWPGRPLYFAKTSGTTSGVKYIPITKDSIPFHINSARNALLAYIHETGKAEFVEGKLIFFSGSPVLENKNGVMLGRLSGIVNHHVPAYLRRNQMPSYATNCIEDWEQKVDAIVEETYQEDMRLISGIPPWVQMYFDKIRERSGKAVKDVFPNFNLFVYGGVNFEPYRAGIEKAIGRKVDTIETYPASEGFIAYQNEQNNSGLLLLTNNGIFYEFIKADEYFHDNPRRYTLAEVELNVNYAIILNTNAGLFGYSIGDTVKFVSLNPYRVKVSGRIKHYISAFGEHMIGEEVDDAMQLALQKHNARALEYTVAPQVNAPDNELPYHEWFIAFDKQPDSLEAFKETLNAALSQRNIYYRDLIQGNILQPLKIRLLKPNAFIHYMKAEGKLGGQNKVPRLSNDRKIADALQSYLE